MYLQTISEEEATGRVADIFEAQKSQMGFVMATAKSFTHGLICCQFILTFPTRFVAVSHLASGNGA